MGSKKRAPPKRLVSYRLPIALAEAIEAEARRQSKVYDVEITTTDVVRKILGHHFGTWGKTGA